VSVVHEEYHVTPIKATHKGDEECHNFIIEKDGRKLLYATDTGFYRDDVFEFLSGRAIDALVVECSEGFQKTPYIGHMDIAQCVKLVDRLRSNGALSPSARVVTTHHAAGGDATHDELVAALKPHDIEAGFDGFSFDV
jgi:phosphoribosyl 1,2-cyclic phosphate phosphodiesterase